MNFLEPAPTPLDLNWRLFGIRFRVHPSFWGVGLLFGYLSSMHLPGNRLLVAMLVWVACMFVSVLVHELGHVLTARIFGERANILLYSFGGYAMGQYDRLSRPQRILVTFMGPGAGFLFLALVVLWDNNSWNAVVDDFLNLTVLKTPWSFTDDISSPVLISNWYTDVRWNLVVMNLFWSVLNLLPIIPMDGGLIMRDVSTGVSPRGGVWFAFGLSFLIAGLIAIYSLIVMQRPELRRYYFGLPIFNLVMFGMMALQNFAALRAHEAEQRRWQYYDD